MQVDVIGENGEPVDLTGWTAVGILHYSTTLYDDLTASSSDTEIELETVENVKTGDVIRFEQPDADRELAIVTAIDRVNDVVTATRGYNGTTPIIHYNDEKVVGIRSSDIPVTILKTEVEDFSYDASEGDMLLTRTYLKVNWRSSDTVQSGQYSLEIKLTGPNGEQMSLPRSGSFSILIQDDSEDS